MSGKTSSSPRSPVPRNTRLRQARKRLRLSQEIVAKQIGVATLTYSRWEKGETFPTQYNLRSLCGFFGMSDEQLGFASEQEQSFHSENTSRIWNVPFEPNPFFTGREEILEILHNTLRNRKTTALTQKQAINGLGGVGKTQTAVEYAYRYANEYEIVLWVKADTRDSITSDFVGIAHLLNLPEKDEQDQHHIVAAVNLWLKSRKNWLLILDNADDVTVASDFIHPTSGGHVILTTRAQNIGRIAYRITIKQMVTEEGVRFLLRRARTLERDIPIDSISKTDRTFAAKIVESLGGLPLALDQAGAYIQETACGLKGYLERYEKHRAELLKLRGKAFMGHPEPVATTWSLSFARLQQTNPAAADLLRVCAFLHPDAIPEEIFLEGATELGPFLQSITSEVGLDALIGELRRHSLLDRYAENKTLRVHRLVQAVLRDGMSGETQHQWVERIVRALNSVFPDIESENSQNCQRFILHAQAIHPAIEQWQIETEEAAHLLLKSGWYLCLQANYDAAEQTCQRSIAIFAQLFGENDPSLVNALNALAELYRLTGKFSQAEPLYKRAITLCQEMPETWLSKMATLLNNLALLYYEQGKYDLAEPLYLRSIEVNTKARGGIEQEYIAQSIANLGLLYYSQGKYAQAERLYQQALAIFEKTSGMQHPDAATCLRSVGELYISQNRYDQAEPFLRQAMDVYEQCLGPNHPALAVTLHLYADVLRKLERVKEAALCERRAKSIQENHVKINAAMVNM